MHKINPVSEAIKALDNVRKQISKAAADEIQACRNGDFQAALEASRQKEAAQGKLAPAQAQLDRARQQARLQLVVRTNAPIIGRLRSQQRGIEGRVRHLTRKLEEAEADLLIQQRLAKRPGIKGKDARELLSGFEAERDMRRARVQAKGKELEHILEKIRELSEPGQQSRTAAK